MSTSAHRLELLSNDPPENVIAINEPNQENNNIEIPLFYFQTSSRVTEPIDTSTYCHLHCRKQMCGIISIIFFIVGGYVTLKMGYFMVGSMFFVLAVIIMIYACTVGYVCCLCFQKTRYDIRFNDQEKMVEIWSSSNKLFAEQEIPYGHVSKFKMETVEQQRVVYGNVVKGSYEDCGVIYVVTRGSSLVRINKYFAIGDEIEHSRHMIEQLNKYWLTDRFCRRLNE